MPKPPLGMALVTLLVAAAPAAATPGHSPMPPRTDRTPHMGVQPAAAAPLAASLQAQAEPTVQTIRVPLDRTRSGGPTLPIAFLVYPHTDTSRPPLEPIFITEGGPGYSVLNNNAQLYRDLVFPSLTDRRDLVLIDQRGVGQSQPIDCDALQQGTAEIYTAVSLCAQHLGSASDLYASTDVALDIEAVRAALGYERFDFYGGSYAGVDILAYAARFPQRLRSVVLDSSFSVFRTDPFFTEYEKAVANTVKLICRRSFSCSHANRNPVRDLRELAKQLRAHPVDGTALDADGVPHQLHVTEAKVANLVQLEQGGYLTQGELAGAADALRRGDAAPLLRLAAETDFPLIAGSGEDPAFFSDGDNIARFCTDFTFPWDTSAPLSQRQAQFAAAKAALAPDRFAPFSVDAWVSSPPDGVFPDPCIRWPAPPHNRPSGLPPGTVVKNVPALLVAGDVDLNVAPAETHELNRIFPRSTFVEIDNATHHTAFGSRFECADTIVSHYIDTLSKGDTSCAHELPFVFPQVGRFAALARLESLAGVTRLAGDTTTVHDRKVARIASVTVTDAFHRSFITSNGTGPGPGLRGGTFTNEFGDDGETLDLDGAKFASDVAVTGHAFYEGFNTIDADLTIAGPDAGTLHMHGDWFTDGATTFTLTGNLGGRTVNLTVPAT